jgi:hypothetical protein
MESIVQDKGYRRSHLRAPHKLNVLHNSPEGILTAKTLNISEGGILLDEVKSFFETREENSLVIPLAQYPVFKNFEIDKLKNFDMEIFPKKIIRAKGRLVRKFHIRPVKGRIASKMAIQFTSIYAHSQKDIDEYVQTFLKNSVHMISLLDMANADDYSREKVVIMARILGYNKRNSLAALRAEIHHDYQSLQWL